MDHLKTVSINNGARRILLLLALISGLCSCSANDGTVDSPAASIAPLSDAPRLLVEIDHASSLSEVKDLQYTYAQYGQYGLWDEMLSLFSADSEIVIIRDQEKDRAIKGKDEIRAYLMSFGDGGQGLPIGWLNTEIFMAPVVTLSGDGTSATGRWQKINMRGQVGGEANWSGGFQVNDYVKENGVWKFSKLTIHEQFEGSYETGWFTVGEQIPFIPYHYSSREAGAPIPAAVLEHTQTLSDDALSLQAMDGIESEVEALLAQDAVNRMQNIYGYYADRKMWDDVADLFMDDASYEIAGLGIYEGVESIRRGLERDGPVGLQRGQVHDQLQMHTVVDVAPNGIEARARGMQWGFLTPELGEAYFTVSTFQNRYVLHDGIWRISEMRVYPKMKTDYYQGWHESVVIDPIPEGKFAPDRPSSADDSPQTSTAIPVFFDNPVTGEPVSYPDGYRVVGDDRLGTEPMLVADAETTDSIEDRIEQVRNSLRLINAVDAVENVSSTWGYYFEDYQWQQYAEVYSPDGWRRKGSGSVYEGPYAIFRVESLGYGPSPTWNRDWIRPHTRVQPVIDVSEDAQSAYIRTRMLLFFANSRSPGAFNSGMYGNDAAVLIDGVWKLSVGGWIDQTYFRSQGYELGWAKPDQTPAVPVQGRAPPVQRDPGDSVVQARRELGSYPGDLEPALGQLGRRAYGVVRGQPGFASWPDIKPMWFHYVNPVSGRVPEFYCADVKICVHEE